MLGEWFQLAENVGWLNVVYRDTRTDEPVYAFFHLTFQEYFAACAVADWHFFLPSDHSPEQPSSQPYRIFESRWREVILLWLGRGDVEDKKEEFIQALVNFKDGMDAQFYKFSALWLAAAGISEFKSRSLADKIIPQLVKWGFGYFNIKKQQWQTFLDPIQYGARDILPQTDRQRAIKELCDLLECLQCPTDTRRRVAVSLGSINPGNAQVIAVLEEIFREAEDIHPRMWVAYSLGNTDPGNAQAISALQEILKETQDTYTRMQAALILKEIDPENVRAISVLKETKHGNTGWQVAESSGKRDPEHPQEIPALVKLLKETNDYSICLQAVWTLGKIGQGNAEAINSLVQLLHQTEDDTTCWQIVESLGDILTTHKQRQEIVLALQPYLSNEKNENNLHLFDNCYELLWKIAQDLPYTDFYRAWHHLDTAPHPEVADQ
ncbi:hypothetical protein BI308_08345 [Roseofilum reptotaenium AO1-A]|uniref:NACHT C-terminal Cysteine and Histidine-containing domain-containing protein n=1 Tax=Roseofilum reptotaenium AO1-A TaxID=1925591 RepID=A0A1L9QTE5_9CYAN|nr:hypothetical protein BI308_08345 [Roseofilum reptotaenium AO1-A]